ncbi:metallophosphoesterase family protein [candidate division KSB1 bacterium]|nr:metallophosphoesterase family protein [candidate division KSB1 bacterium]
MEPLAIMSDIHGNRWALEAVLEDIEKRNILNIVNLGDVLYGPLDPAGTANLLMPLGLSTVSGNQDRIIIDPSIPNDFNPTLQFVRRSLEKNHLMILETLPKTHTIDDTILLFHGTPEHDETYLLLDVHKTGISLKSDNELSALLQNRTESVFLCGHDHTPNIVTLPDGKIIVNPGSVGLQAYDDDEPFPHAIDNGSPHARYSILSQREYGFYIEHIMIPYDHHSASATAITNGRPDWGEWLKTGRATIPNG